MTDPNALPPQNGIRAENEDDRSAEFKTARDDFVTGVNGWLAKVDELRETGQTMPDGRIITTVPRLKTYDMGKTRAGRSLVTESSSGVSLTGEAGTSPLVFQSVQQQAAGGSEIVTATGTDPVGSAVHEGYTSARAQEVIAQVFYKKTYPEGPASEAETTVWGDGHVSHRHIDPNSGWNISGPVRSPNEVQGANEAAAGVLRDLLP